jgi:hypothetical protein
MKFECPYGWKFVAKVDNVTLHLLTPINSVAIIQSRTEGLEHRQ